MVKKKNHKQLLEPPECDPSWFAGAELRLRQKLQPICRIVRFTSLDADTVCLYDKDKKLLCIDRENYDKLSPRDQTTVFRACESIIITHTGKTVPA